MKNEKAEVKFDIPVTIMDVPKDDVNRLIMDVIDYVRDKGHGVYIGIMEESE